MAIVEPWFGLLLSCFGHARAKNNSELSCGLNGVLLLFGTVTWLFCLLHRAVKGFFLRYAVGGHRTVVSGMWRLGMLEKASVVATSLALAFPSSLMTW